MKLKIKSSYMIMGKRIKIKMVASNSFMGLWDPAKLTVYLATNQTPEQLQETFWHEMNHVMQWMSGVHQAVSGELMEIMAEMNSRITAQIIRES